jgi:hypothetical protein
MKPYGKTVDFKFSHDYSQIYVMDHVTLEEDSNCQKINVYYIDTSDINMDPKVQVVQKQFRAQ